MKFQVYLVLVLSFISFGLFSQERVQNVEPFKLEKYEVDKIVRSGKGDLIEIKLSEKEKFTAIVNMSVLNTDIITIGAQIQGKTKTFITLSKYVNDDKVIYSGDIISHETNEAYSIFTNPENGEIYIKPVGKNEIIVED